MLNQEQRKEYIRQIETLPEILESTIRGLSDEKLDVPYRDGGWTIRQVVHHLADSHLSGYARMKLVHTEEKPLLKSYEQNMWAQLSDVHLPLDSSLSILRGLHHRWTVFLRSVPENSWTRTGVHTEHGEMSLDDLLVDYADHGRNHVDHIKRGL
jgi:hypothetical protein